MPGKLLGINQCYFVGNVTKDTELRTSENGRKFLFFDLACNEPQGDETHTEFVPIQVWGKMAEHFVDRLVKGARVSVCGPIRIWKKQVDGGWQTKASVLALTLVVGAMAQEKKQDTPPPPDDPFESDNLPF